MWVSSTDGGFAGSLARNAGAEARIMWFDAEANLVALSTREGVVDMVAKCKAANINTIIVDVKPLAGVVLYDSKIAPKLTHWRGKDYPQGYDLLQTVIEESHKVGIPVHAAVNVFSEGSMKDPGGPALDHTDWQCVELQKDGALRRVGELGDMHNAVFVNPLHPEVRNYALSIFREICENYDIDGIVPDRMRFPNLYADFSDITRRTFEEQIGHPIENWPADIMTRTENALEPVRGPLFKPWLKFRAKIIRDFLTEVRSNVKSIKPDVTLGIYVGSWYPVYYDVGVNWGSPTNACDYEWWPEGYEQTGFADLVDYMCTGCYYANAKRSDSIAAGEPEWKSVEASAQESVNAVKDDTFVYASLYLLEYAGHPEKFIDAMKQCAIDSQGCMLFDLVYARDYDWWNAIKTAFPNEAEAPHDVPGLLTKLREMKASSETAASSTAANLSKDAAAEMRKGVK